MTAKLLGSVMVLSCAAAAQQTWVVDEAMGPGAQFPEIQDAVDAAAPGDHIQVRAGTYRPVTVTKGVSIYADAGANPFPQVPHTPSAIVDGPTLVANLPAGQKFSMHGIGATAPAILATSPALVIIDCRGGGIVAQCNGGAGSTLAWEPQNVAGGPIGCITTVVRTLPNVAITGLVRGQQAGVELRGDAGQVQFLFAGSGVAVPAATPFGEVWMDTIAPAYLGSFIIGQAGSISLAFPVPASLPQGLVFTLQAIALEAGGARAGLPMSIAVE